MMDILNRIGIGIFAAAMLSSAALPCVAGVQPVKLSATATLCEPAKHKPQYFAAAAWSAQSKCWLAVWQDGAPTDDGTDGSGPAQNILAVRVSVDGKVIDSRPITVCTANNMQQRPQVASDGTGWLVVWHDFRNNEDWDVYGARVSADGKPLDNNGVLLFGGKHNQCFPNVTFSAGNYYVAWLDMRNWPEYRVYGSRVSPAGKPLNADGLELLRPMTDKDVEAWKKAPFSPGKQGTGWHYFGVRGARCVNQPAPPTLAADGNTVLVASPVHNTGQIFATSRSIDASTGQPKSPQATFGAGLTAGGHIAYSHSSPLQLMAPGNNRFLAATYLIVGSWETGPGFWSVATLNASGQAFNAKTPFSYAVADAAAQKMPPGYRTYGMRHVVQGLAWDGKRGLYVSEYHRHNTNPRSGEVTPANIDVLAMFIDADGKRLIDPAADASVEPDPLKKAGGGIAFTEGEKVAPFSVAGGPTTQSWPCVSAGPEGSFLVIWQDETPGRPSRIIARLVQVK